MYGCQQIRQVHMYESYHLYSCLTSTLERKQQHIAIADFQATFQHHVAAHCNHIFKSNSSQCYYVEVQLMHLDESHEEYSGTARVCTSNINKQLYFNGQPSIISKTACSKSCCLVGGVLTVINCFGAVAPTL